MYPLRVTCCCGDSSARHVLTLSGIGFTMIIIIILSTKARLVARGLGYSGPSIVRMEVPVVPEPR